MKQQLFQRIYPNKTGFGIGYKQRSQLVAAGVPRPILVGYITRQRGVLLRCLLVSTQLAAILGRIRQCHFGKALVVLVLAWIMTLPAFYGTGFCAEAPLSLERYLELFLQDNPKIKAGSARVKQGRLDIELTGAFYKTQLGVGVHLQKDRNSGNSGGLIEDQNLLGLDSKITQNFAGGTSMEFNYQYSKAISQSKDSQDPNQIASIQWNKSLYRDWQGKLERLREDEALENLEILKVDQIQAQIDQCIEGSLLFFDVYYKQEIVNLFRLNMIDAEEVYRSYTKLRKARLVKQIDFLRAKQDFFTMKSNHADMQHQLRKSQLLLRSPLDVRVSVQLKEPNAANLLDDSQELVGAITGSGNYTDLEVASLELVDKKLAIAASIIKQEGLSEVKLSIEGGQSRSQTAMAHDTNYRDDRNFVGIGIKFEWPINDKSYDINLEKAYLEKVRNQYELERVKADNGAKLAIGAETMAYLESKEMLAKEKWLISQQELKEAGELVRNSQMELTDYIRDRTNGMSHRIEYLETKLARLINLLDIQRRMGRLPQYCHLATNRQG